VLDAEPLVELLVPELVADVPALDAEPLFELLVPEVPPRQEETKESHYF